MKARIYHNPRCSKSRATLELLRNRGVELEVIEYLQAPPSRSALERLLAKLDLEPIDLLRRAEPEVAASGIDVRDPEAVLQLLLECPRVLQRPIVEIDDAACIGRPPERVLELLALLE